MLCDDSSPGVPRNRDSTPGWPSSKNLNFTRRSNMSCTEVETPNGFYDAGHEWLVSCKWSLTVKTICGEAADCRLTRREPACYRTSWRSGAPGARRSKLHLLESGFLHDSPE